MTHLIWSSPAVRDLYKIAADAGEIDPDLPAVYLERIETAPLPLLDFPEMGSPVGRKGIRKWRVRKTPFILFYAVRERTIEIRRVVAAASDWSEWLR